MSTALHLVPVVSQAEESGGPLFTRLRTGTGQWTHLGENSVLVVGTAADQAVRLVGHANSTSGPPAEFFPQTWIRSAPDANTAVGFAALVRPKDPQGRIGTLALATRLGQTALRLPRKPASIVELVDAVAQDSGAAFGDVVEALVEAILRGDAKPAEIQLAKLLLAAAARPCGFVEIVAHLDGQSFVQGWSSELKAGETRIIVAGETLSVTGIEAATFTRGDLDENSHGFFGLVDGESPIESVDRLFFRASDRWCCLEIYDRRLILKGTDVPAYMRDGLARGSAPPRTLERLGEVAQRFDGRDTVSTLGQPVRMGIDLATSIEGAGILVAGWLMDPLRLVASVALRHGQAATRLDEIWTRLTRPDVTATFAGDPAFLSFGANETHGFIAFAAEAASDPSRSIYFDLTLQDGRHAYLPLNAAASPLRPAVERILGLLDPQASSTAVVIEHQIAPVLAAATGPGPRVCATLECGTKPADGPLAVVVGLDRGHQDITPILTALAIDEEVRVLPIIVAAPKDIYDSIGTQVKRLAQFYGLSLRLVLADGVDDGCDALQAGLQGCRSETLVFLSGHAQPRSRGWLGLLEKAYRAEKRECMVSPTLLFEDDSIRWAGSWPGAGGLTDRLIGYPVEAIEDFRSMEVVAGTAECCILPRAAFERCNGFSRGYLTSGDKSTDLGLRLRQSGAPCLWLPQVWMYLTDETRPAMTPFAARHACAADRLGFERRWSAVLSEMRD